MFESLLNVWFLCNTVHEEIDCVTCIEDKKEERLENQMHWKSIFCLMIASHLLNDFYRKTAFCITISKSDFRLTASNSVRNLLSSWLPLHFHNCKAEHKFEKRHRYSEGL